jgi:hypothetical protein
VKAGRDEETGAERHYIGPIVISLKRDLAASMEKLLLKAVFRIGSTCFLASRIRIH